MSSQRTYPIKSLATYNNKNEDFTVIIGDEALIEPVSTSVMGIDRSGEMGSNAARP